MEWRHGALFGLTPAEAFYVKCDDETNPAEGIDVGQVVCEIGVAPVKPAEFVIFRLVAVLRRHQPGQRVARLIRSELSRHEEVMQHGSSRS